VTLTLPSSDVVVGYQASSGSSTLTAWAAGGTFPNTIQATTRRSSSVNGALPLFFAPILGIKTWTGGATAKATVNLTQQAVTGFSGSPTSPLPGLLPIAIDVSFWKTFLSSGKSPDGTVHDAYTASQPTSQTPAPNTVSSGADGIPEFNDAYPNSTSPGNFGLISLQNSKATSEPTYSHWIDNGPSAADLQSFGSSGLQATPSSPATMYGGPGLKSALLSDFQSIIGQPRAVPLFSSYGGNGSNTQYTVVGFAGVTVVSATGHGSNMNIVVQPMILINKNVTTTTGVTTGSSFVYSQSPISLTK
jgi:hypothetical protein